MRVISGTARGRRLIPPKDRTVRPTSDRVKEALFSIIASQRGSLEGLSVLDLCAGTGSLGIEALSRGAGRALFVDAAKSSVSLIDRNLSATGFSERSRVVQADCTAILPALAAKGELFDIAFADPPYSMGIAEKILTQVASHKLLNADGLLIIETEDHEELPKICENLHQTDRRVYGDTAITIFSNSI